jgi:hypothetical protein
MHVAHSRFDAIVSRCILQGKGVGVVGVLAGLSQKGVPQSMSASIGMSINLLA